MENKMIWSVIRAAVLTLQLVAEVLAAVFVLSLNILPPIYLVVFLGILAILAEGSVLFMFVRVKDRIRLWRKIVSCVLAVLIVVGCALLSKVAWRTHGFLGNVTGIDENAESRKIHVVVLQENPANSLEDTKGYRYGVLEDFETEYTALMIAEIEKATGESLSLVTYPQVIQMADALYNREIDAIIMHEVSLSLLFDQQGYEDFESRVKFLNSLSYKPENSSPDDEPGVNAEIARSPFAVYISGSDTRSSRLEVGRSDVNILVVVNPNTKQILLINTPRDYYIPNPAGKGKLDKLTHCGNYGINCSIEALETLYKTEINYYGRINFGGFEKLIDSIGGITVVSDESFSAQGYPIQKGENQLDGKHALMFARERHTVSGGDNGRGKNQMKVIKAVIEKLTSSTALISNYSSILNSLEGMFATNFHADELSALVKMQLSNMASWNIQSFAVTGIGDYQETYSWQGTDLWVMWPNEKSVNHAITLINRVLGGETITAADMKVPK